MKIKNKITTLLAAVLLTACTDYNVAPTYTVGEADNTIVLQAGVMEGASGEITRAVDDEANHSKHTPFAENTVIALRMDGLWTGHSPSTDIKKKTNATLGAASGTDNKHNELKTFTPQFYWDDYGTADPNNTSGRAQGLTIYGAAINDGKNTLPSSLSSLDDTQSTWTSLSWTIETNQKDKGIVNSDLLTSNNVVYKAAPATSNSYQFDYKADGKLLVFTHAMSKVTVVLTAGEGFPRTDTNDANTAQFQAEPTVTLKNFYNAGTVDVETKTSNPTTSSTSDISMHRETPATWANSHEVTFEAVVFPGNTFADGTQILTLSVDGNDFNVTAKMLNAAIRKVIDDHTNSGYPLGNSNLSSDPKVYDTHLQQAWNYKLKITVDKTALGISATIEAWNEVEAAEDKPKINFSQCYGQEGTNFAKGFTLYRSKTVTGSYIDGLTEGNTSTVSYSSAYTMSPQLYWPDHQTHYFFRGVWPQVNTTDGPATGNVKANAVDVTNVAYALGKYPSDLMIGMPRKADGTPDEHCKSTHNVDGICATDATVGATHANEGLIHMNFQFTMSQVEVELKTVDSPDAAKVNINENTVVELVNVYNSGEVKLSDGSVSVSGDKGSYTLATVAGDDKKLFRHSAIVPQELTFTEKGAATNLRFKITVTNTDGTTDVYYADVKPIKEKDKETLVAPNGKWESGVHYKYVLTLSKTAINVTATIKDWVPVTASDKVWF